MKHRYYCEVTETDTIGIALKYYLSPKGKEIDFDEIKSHYTGALEYISVILKHYKENILPDADDVPYIAYKVINGKGETVYAIYANPDDNRPPYLACKDSGSENFTIPETVGDFRAFLWGVHGINNAELEHRYLQIKSHILLKEELANLYE